MMNNQKLAHWADQTAEKIIRERGDLDLYTCASGITPSGVVHIGNFREIISVELVVRALKARGKNVRFIYSWDDYDVFRKVPKNMPQPELLEKYLRFPITMVPDPYGRDESYARHHEVDVESILPVVGIFPEFLYQADRYRSGMYAEGIKTALNKKEKIKECLNVHRDEQHKIPDSEEYWPVSVFCANCNRDTTRIESWDGDWNLSYSCDCGYSETVDLRKPNGVKLGWRIDWPMRWEREKVMFEPAGKDHHSQGGSFDTARLVAKEIYNWEAPVTFRYDFIGIKGSAGKISSSSGEVIALQDVLRVYQPEITRYLFAGTRPNTEFVISFDLDVIKIYEDYDKTERIAWGAERAKNDEVLEKEKRIYELSQVSGMPECISYQIPFRHLCNLLQINDGNIEAVISGLPDVQAGQIERLKTRAACAWYWITECAPDDFRFSLRPEGEKAGISGAALNALMKIRNDLLPRLDELDEKAVSQVTYDIAAACGIEPKELFTATYQALIGKDQGPRLASFMKIIGKDRLEKILSAY
ncbi:lysine--tRNA ligase [Brucepastera parasyntrophica]|uniref:lysine--tRNA ligase n=1 Tax=Brucepastera parasyntrophica TaxID=2880008 RepID=UPI00210AB7DE|nr:lysine--tRNA ligase [Brucepastera parasyntrophica]ULQ61151.1 lysine--tRNA ligase [Brucepastera parasyntrophica]